VYETGLYPSLKNAHAQMRGRNGVFLTSAAPHQDQVKLVGQLANGANTAVLHGVVRILFEWALADRSQRADWFSPWDRTFEPATGR
jgi:hypothetical protein